MLKQILLSSATLLLLSGCVTKEIIQVPVPVPQNSVMLDTHTFAGETLTASAEVSRLIHQIKSLSSHSAYLDLNSNHSIKVGDFLNISVTPNQAGYLKLMIIDPNGDRKLVLPNSISKGYLKANQYFTTNNEQFGLKTTKPRGLHHVVVIFSEQNARMAMIQGANGYDAVHNDQDLITLLQNIKNGRYGKSHISVFPMRIY